MSIRTSNCKSLAALGLAALLALAPAVAQAKMGGGASSGSRGSRTFSAPPATTTAPRAAAPMERSIAPQSAPSQTRPAYNPSSAPSAGLFGGGFGRGLLGGLAGGLLGAGLFGLLTGHGLFGGLGEITSIIGLLLQIALIYLLVRLALNWFAGRGLAFGGAGAAPGAEPGAARFSGLGFGGGAGRAAPRPRDAGAPLALRKEDFDAFERLLGETQAAYGEQDIARLQGLATPEMVSYFQADIDADARKGVANRISGVKLLQGDLSEAWREGADEYATVAMRFSLVDLFVDKASGRIVSGDPAQPIQSTEIWTFRRPAGRGPEAWKLSAIQQTA